MSTKHIIARGIGFSPGSVKYVPTHGLASAAVTIAAGGLIAAVWWHWWVDDFSQLVP